MNHEFLLATQFLCLAEGMMDVILCSCQDTWKAFAALEARIDGALKDNAPLGIQDVESTVESPIQVTLPI